MSLLAAAAATRDRNGTGANMGMTGGGFSSSSLGGSSESRDIKKWTRFAVVVLYLLSVSLAAIFLATYYMVFWDAKQVYCRYVP